MDIVDSNHKFVVIDVGSIGRFSDGNIFLLHCCFRAMNRRCTIFVGDEAFPLSENLMRHYPRCKVSDNYENNVFNYRLSRAVAVAFIP
ncbi:hypothetical protein PR048_008863 [Dryococelus australis]|uniref:DDE Tnp4 domain-containing protein n=1 Tax=Dryococelus australis TaxID=614101 RepID=A0ABQ9HYB5_9NEOP|nr:hypothetical protein PR048_008863 [Dryococelus australis]